MKAGTFSHLFLAIIQLSIKKKKKQYISQIVRAQGFQTLTQLGSAKPFVVWLVVLCVSCVVVVVVVVVVVFLAFFYCC